jgi:hypothetical protein
MPNGFDVNPGLASLKMMSGDLPPSSRVTFLMPLAPASMILEPVLTLPAHTHGDVTEQLMG